VILVTHDMVEAFTLARRIGVVDAGALIACDTPDAIAHSREPRVKILLDTMSVTALGATS
jgi:osmoprotectant transport system ATP-binding protein